MLNHHNSTAVLIRTEDDGTLVYRHKNRIVRVARAVAKPGELTGFYPPGGRRALYKSTGGKDQRNTKWYAEAVRERRSKGHRAGVRPGPQSMT
jgi:hypothetical protein